MIRIALIDDHAIVRNGLREFLSDRDDMRVVLEADNGKDAVKILRGNEADVIILDISMPGENGVDTLAAIRSRDSKLPVLILSGFSEAQYAALLLRQGASGYLCKDCEPEDIVHAIRTVHAGRKYVSATLAESLAAGPTEPRASRPIHESLSEREFQIFLRLATGASIAEVAQSLFLNVKTVSTYRTRMMAKMNMQSNSELTYYAMKHGLMA